MMLYCAMICYTVLCNIIVCYSMPTPAQSRSGDTMCLTGGVLVSSVMV